MAALDNITNLAQDVYFTINGSENDDTGEDLTIFQNEFIRAFNLWVEEYEVETYWNKLRINDYPLALITDTTTYVFQLPDTIQTPVINQDKYVKIVTNDGVVLSSFKLVDPNQRVDDSEPYHPDRASFVGTSIVLSRAPYDTEVGSTLILDVVQYHPRLASNDDSGIDYLPSKQLAVLGIAKNMTLSNPTKVSLSPTYAQKYNEELKKQKASNDATNETYDAQRDNYGYINGIW